jgi:hypothetical protein
VTLIEEDKVGGFFLVVLLKFESNTFVFFLVLLDQRFRIQQLLRHAAYSGSQRYLSRFPLRAVASAWVAPPYPGGKPPGIVGPIRVDFAPLASRGSDENSEGTSHSRRVRTGVELSAIQLADPYKEGVRRPRFNHIQ